MRPVRKTKRRTKRRTKSLRGGMNSWVGSLGSGADDGSNLFGDMFSVVDPFQFGRDVGAAPYDPDDVNPPEGPCRKMKPTARTWEPRYFRLVCWCQHCRREFAKYDFSEIGEDKREMWLPPDNTSGQILYYDSEPRNAAQIYTPLTWDEPRGSSIMNIRGCGVGKPADELFSAMWPDNNGRNKKHHQPALKMDCYEKISSHNITFPSQEIRDKVYAACNRMSYGKHWKVDAGVDAVEAATLGARKARAAMGAMGAAFGGMMSPEETGGAAGPGPSPRQGGAAGFADMAAEVGRAAAASGYNA